jgi:hypothetical protein
MNNSGSHGWLLGGAVVAWLQGLHVRRVMPGMVLGMSLLCASTKIALPLALAEIHTALLLAWPRRNGKVPFRHVI